MSPQERQSARQRHLNLQQSVNRTRDRSQHSYFFAVDDKLKLIYCIIPKVSSTLFFIRIYFIRISRPKFVKF